MYHYRCSFTLWLQGACWCSFLTTCYLIKWPGEKPDTGGQGLQNMPARRGQSGHLGPNCWKARSWVLDLIMSSLIASNWILALLDQDVGFLIGFQKWLTHIILTFSTAAALGVLPLGLNRNSNWGDRCFFYDAKWDPSQRIEYGRWELSPNEHLFISSFFLHKFEISKQFLCIHGLYSSKCKPSVIQFNCHFYSLAVIWVRSHNY